MKTATNVMAITDLTGDAAGAIVLWRLQGETDLLALTARWAELNLDAKLLPSLPSPERALRRAMKEHESKRTLVYALPGRGTGYALVNVNERADDESQPLNFNTSLTVKLAGEALTFNHLYDSALMQKIEADFRANLQRLESSDTASWLSDMVRVVKAVPLRDTGGVYFVPRETLGTWRAITSALRSASATYVAEIPALRSSEAVDAILDSLTREAGAQLAEIEGELAAGSEKELGARALETRAGKCQLLADKLTTYEKLLGVQLTTLQERLVGLQANIAAAALIANAPEAAA